MHIIDILDNLALFLLVLLALNNPDPIRADSFCGNAKYDPPVGKNASEWNRKVPKSFRRFRARAMIPEEVRNERLSTLSTYPVLVRLSIVYDKTFAAAFNYDANEIKLFVKNLVFGVQLIYEQPEMSDLVKFDFRVVSLAQAEDGYISEDKADAVLYTFNRYSQNSDEDIDINVFMAFKRFWDVFPNMLGQVLGVSYTHTFCRLKDTALIIDASALGRGSLTFAHELAHSLGGSHDDGKKCNGDTFLMSPKFKDYQKSWSSCTTNDIASYLIQEEVFSCLYDKQRYLSSPPFDQSFNFANYPGNPNRITPPGRAITIDGQCQRSIDPSAVSNFASIGVNSAYQSIITCETLVCRVQDRLIVNIGPAAIGSKCSNTGRCWKNECLASIPL